MRPGRGSRTGRGRRAFASPNPQLTIKAARINSHQALTAGMRGAKSPPLWIMRPTPPNAAPAIKARARRRLRTASLPAEPDVC